uniref:BHLH domain-containing protein n=1 Tax=Heterorhabditis bacteriophora TaxID=37862 RepID=A0A1I7WYY1_HETBA
MYKVSYRMISLLYHRMSLEEKRQYNQRRTESFRKRRLEEEILLSTPAGRISADALQKAQQIMIRNVSNETSRILFYLTTNYFCIDNDYNTRRAQAKKLRAVARGGTPGMMSSDCSIVSGGDLSESGGLGTSFQSDPSNLLEEQTDSSHSLPPIVQSQHASDDIFQQMERDVIKRTKQAHMALARQQQTSQSQSLQIHSGSTFTSSVHDSQLLGGDTVLITNDGHLINQEKVYVQQSQLIDEKALHQMLLTGHDANGQPVELRTVDGTPIRGEEQLRSVWSGLHLVPTTTSISMQSSQPLYASHEVVIDDIPNPIRYRNTASESQSATDILAEATAAATMTVAQRHELSKARRAERARLRFRITYMIVAKHIIHFCVRIVFFLRYHSMQPESRQRDDELCHLAETCQLESLDEETRRAISEAQSRRARRAEQARAKYHRMNSEERRQYNAMRDAQRRQRKREQEARAREQVESSLSPGGHGGGSLSPSASVEQGQQIIYSTYEMYQEPMGSWEQ